MNPVVTGGQGLVRVPSFGSGQRAAITVKCVYFPFKSLIIVSYFQISFDSSFNCINEGPGGFGWVSLAIDIDPFNPISFAWFKKCPAPPSSWTGFGIFCFVYVAFDDSVILQLHFFYRVFCLFSVCSF